MNLINFLSALMGVVVPMIVSFFHRILKQAFGNRALKKSASRYRSLRLESLESREHLSVSPLLPTLFSVPLSEFEDDTPAYIQEYSNTETNNAASRVNGLEASPMMMTTIPQNMSMGMVDMGDKEMDCCMDNLGTITVTASTTNLGEIASGFTSQGIAHITRSNDDDCGIESDVTIIYHLSGTAQPGSDYTALSGLSPHTDTDGNLLYYEGTLTLPSGVASYDYYINVLNDSIPESEETIVFTLISASGIYCVEYTASGSVDFTIQDDDKWKVDVTASDSVATERLADVTPDYGEFTFTRTHAITGDTSYAVTVNFDMIYDSAVSTNSANNKLASPSSDYALQYLTGNQWMPLSANPTPTTNGTETRYHYTVTIAAGQTQVKVRLVPNFDWEDEAELFDPFGGGSSKDNTGEFANLEIMDVNWTGKGSWDAKGSTLTAKVEIKDGAFVSVTSDFDNNGTINKADYDVRRDDVGSLVLLTAQDIARYYAWVDVLGSHTYDLVFQGIGGISINTTTMSIYEGYNLATGTVTVVGASNSANISSGSLSLTVGAGSDWTRFTVFSVTVDMAFNHDRGVNDGTDGINIRTDASNNTEHDAPEFRQNAPKTGESWLTPNGNNNQKTVLYLKDKSVTVYNRFKTSIAIPGGITLKLDANSTVAIAGLQETNVTFGADGYSTGGKTVAGVAGFIEFAAKANTAATVKKEAGTFTWNVTKIADKTTGTGTALNTDQMTFYTILDVPKDPWDVSDTTALPNYPNTPPYSPEDNKMQPWVTVLETMTNAAWCAGKTTVEEVAAKITTELYEGGRFRYEPSGPLVYVTTATLPYFDLTAFHNQLTHPNPAPTTVGCADMAWGVRILSNLLGDNLNVMLLTGTTQVQRLNAYGNPVTVNVIATQSILPIGANNVTTKE